MRCSLGFLHRNDVQFVLPPVVCRRAHVLFNFIFFCLRIDILSCVFDLLFFVLCTISCQYLWIVHLDCPFSISLAFIHAKLSTTNPCLLNILVYFYLIYQHLTTTSIRLHQRSNFKEPINDEPIIL